MPSNLSVVISNLGNDTFLSSSDFFPLVSSSSLTSYRVSFNTLQQFLGLPQVSCSYSSQSVSSSYSLSSSYPPYPQTSASWASQSISSSYSITSSWAPHSAQIFYTSMSWASRSLSSSYALTASFSPQSFVFQSTCSWVSQSVSSSYTLSASWAPPLSIIQTGLFTYYPTPYYIIADSNPNIPYYTATMPFNYGLIISIGDSKTEFGRVYATSSLVPLTSIWAGGHGDNINTFYLNIGPDEKFLLYTSASLSFKITASIVGYY